MKKVVKILVVVLALSLSLAMFAACAPSNAEKATDKLKGADYTVVSNSVSDKEKEEGVVGSILATKGGLIPTDFVAAIWYASSGEAKTAYEDNKEDFESIKSTYQKLLGEDKEIVIARSGKCIYVASEQGAKDFA